MAVTSKDSAGLSGSELTREKIIAAAAKAFAEHGFSGATLRDIGDAAGTHFQLIRHHFGSKEQLWETVVAELSRRAQEVGLHHEQAISALAPRDQLKAQVRALVAHQIENPELIKILMRESMKGSERYRKVYDPYVRRFATLAETFLGRMQREGVIRDDIPLENLAMVFRGALDYRLLAREESELYTGKENSLPESIEEHADAVAKLLLKD